MTGWASSASGPPEVTRPPPTCCQALHTWCSRWDMDTLTWAPTQGGLEGFASGGGAAAGASARLWAQTFPGCPGPVSKHGLCLAGHWDEVSRIPFSPQPAIPGAIDILSGRHMRLQGAFIHPTRAQSCLLEAGLRRGRRRLWGPCPRPTRGTQWQLSAPHLDTLGSWTEAIQVLTPLPFPLFSRCSQP